jgi:5-(carboxyamino)imidazole ribonucleotide mutase
VKTKKNTIPKVAIIMGSKSDWPTMKLCGDILKKLQVKFDAKIISAHRTPNRMYAFAKNAEIENYSVIIAGAGGSAHLPGMIASMSSLPVIGVPIESKKLKGLDSLLSIVQMPKGIPVGTVAIGKDGAINAGIMAASIIALSDKKIKINLVRWRNKQTNSVKKKPN